MPRHRRSLLLASLVAAGCSPSDGRDAAAAPAVSTVAAVPARGSDAAATAWHANPAEGVTVTPSSASDFTLQAGPHVIAWRVEAAELTPPYTVRGTLQKSTGRIHEGVGLLFGGTALEGPESGQQYSYFLTRGDGSFLIKQRRGVETPVVRDWTAHAAIRRDADGTGRPNELRVDVGEEETVFFINDAEVARVPTADLQVRGRAGVRASHDVLVRVRGFQAGAGSTTP
jgi:hypothetical protein